MCDMLTNEIKKNGVVCSKMQIMSGKRYEGCTLITPKRRYVFVKSMTVYS